MDVRRPALLTLRVASLERALAFWHGRLGLPVKLRSARIAELQSDTILVALVAASDATAGAAADPDSAAATADPAAAAADPADDAGNVADGSPARGSVALAWETDDLEAARRELEAKGIACADLPMPDGVDPAIFGRRVGFADPDGHRLEIVSWAVSPAASAAPAAPR